MLTRKSRKPRLNADGFPARLREARLKKNLGQAEVAAAVGITETQYGHYERGKSGPSAEVLRRMVEVLETSADYLLQGVQPHVPQRLADPELFLVFQDVEQLPQEDQAVVKTVINALLFQRRIQQVSRGTSRSL